MVVCAILFPPTGLAAGALSSELGAFSNKQANLFPEDSPVRPCPAQPGVPGLAGPGLARALAGPGPGRAGKAGSGGRGPEVVLVQKHH
jgi:hypothetical protein